MGKLSKAKEKESAELISQDNWEPGQSEKHVIENESLKMLIVEFLRFLSSPAGGQIRLGQRDKKAEATWKAEQTPVSCNHPYSSLSSSFRSCELVLTLSSDLNSWDHFMLI